MPIKKLIKQINHRRRVMESDIDLSSIRRSYDQIVLKRQIGITLLNAFISAQNNRKNDYSYSTDGKKEILETGSFVFYKFRELKQVPEKVINISHHLRIVVPLVEDFDSDGKTVILVQSKTKKVLLDPKSGLYQLAQDIMKDIANA